MPTIPEMLAQQRQINERLTNAKAAKYQESGKYSTTPRKRGRPKKVEVDGSTAAPTGKADSGE